METLMQQSSPMSTNEEQRHWKRIKPNPSNYDSRMLHNKFVFEKLVYEKKLSLVLDLDQTLLHTVKIDHLTPEDRDVVLQDRYDPSLSSLFRIKFSEDDDYVTKMRPGLRCFLEEASKFFQLHVFTKGTREYTMEVLKFIDAGRDYFGCKSSSSSSRVFTRENCVGKKSLDLVMGKASGLLILDDKESVWREVDKVNVLEIPQYDFFELGSNYRILSGGDVRGRDESETEGCLIEYLKVLKLIHAMFFDPYGEGHILERDVRVLKNKLYYAARNL